jgi:hypothetical protein
MEISNVAYWELGPYPAVNIISLILLENPTFSLPMDHATIQGYGLFEDGIKHGRPLCVPQGIDPPIRYSQVNRFCKV